MGDYDCRRHSFGYVSEFHLIPNQSSDFENRVTELHQQLKGMSPSIAELNYLDKVKWHDMYGVDLHPVLVSIKIYACSFIIQFKCKFSILFVPFIEYIIFHFIQMLKARRPLLF